MSLTSIFQRLETEIIVETNSGSLYRLWMADGKLMSKQADRIRPVANVGIPNQKKELPLLSNVHVGRVLYFDETNRTGLIMKVFTKTEG